MCVTCGCDVAVQGAVVAVENPERRIYGLQYHPEVMHTEGGLETIKHFLMTVAGLKPDWTMSEVLQEQLRLVAAQVRGGPGLENLALYWERVILACCCALSSPEANVLPPAPPHVQNESHQHRPAGLPA